MNLLSEDNFSNIFNHINSHKNLCLLKMVDTNFNNYLSFIIDKQFSIEKIIIDSIIKKIIIDDYKNIKTDSIELFKWSLGWIDNDNSQENFNLCSFFRSNIKVINIDIIDMFYCDCMNCFRTQPCGLGNIKPFSKEEETFLTKHFQWDWWNQQENNHYSF